MPHVADDELLSRAQAGDRTALERLLLDHYGAVERHVAARLPQQAQGALAVEDVLQQTFLQAFRDMPRFRPQGEGSFSAWLRAIADHRLQDALRGLRRQKRGGGRTAAALPADGSGSYAELVELLAVDPRDPVRSATRREAGRAIQVGLAGLPADQREAVMRVYLEGSSLDETAVAMRRSSGAVRGLLHRAKQELRSALGRSSLWLSRK